MQCLSTMCSKKNQRDKSFIRLPQRTRCYTPKLVSKMKTFHIQNTFLKSVDYQSCVFLVLGCVYDGVVRHHGDAWSPGPCIPECRCSHGHVKCSKIECPDLNCDKPIKKKWKCCSECLPLMDNGKIKIPL